MIRRRRFVVLTTIALLVAPLIGLDRTYARNTGNYCPKSKECVILCPVDFDGPIESGETVTADLLAKQGYHIQPYINGTLNNDPACKLSHWVISCGVRFWGSHGSATTAVVEIYKDKDDRDAALKAYLEDDWTEAEIAADEMLTQNLKDEQDQPFIFYYIYMTSTGFTNHVKANNNSNETITFAGSCDSEGLSGCNGGREFFGYDDDSMSGSWAHDAGVLWRYMAGVWDCGESRPAGDAFSAGLPYGSGEMYFLDGSGGLPGKLVQADLGSDGKTTLCPTVAETVPGEGGEVTEGQTCYVQFDSYMGPPPALPAENSVVTSPWLRLDTFAWNESYDTLSFKAHDIWMDEWYTLTVHANKAAAWGDRLLDGNQNPGGTDGTAPNQDNYLWNVFSSYYSPDPSFLQADRRNLAGLLRARGRSKP